MQPVVELAPAPIPDGVPVIGPEGVDSYGYPLRYVNRPALRSLLLGGRYDELTQDLEAFQAAFESDPYKEYWPTDAGDAFGSADPRLLAGLNEWIAASPKSFAPYLARGTYWTAIAYARRGTAFAQETARENLLGMERAIDAALDDLTTATRLRPKLVAAYRVQIQAYVALGEKDDVEGAIQHAIQACPDCFQVRVVYLYSLTPKWGGSDEEMAAFAKQSLSSKNPKMRLLAGYVDLDKAETLRHDKDFAGAIAAINRPLTLGGHWEFYFERGKVKYWAKDSLGAIADLDLAASMRPALAEIYTYRAAAHFDAGHAVQAAQDLIAGLQSDPTDSMARAYWKSIVYAVGKEAEEQLRAGQRDEAIRTYDLALQLDPSNTSLQDKRSAAVLGDAVKDDPLAALEEAVRNAPDELTIHRQLDSAYARLGRYSDVVELWNDFLSRNPTVGEAYLERGGSYFHLQKLTESLADAKKACELGVHMGCVQAQRLAPATP